MNRISPLATAFLLSVFISFLAVHPTMAAPIDAGTGAGLNPNADPGSRGGGDGEAVNPGDSGDDTTFDGSDPIFVVDPIDLALFDVNDASQFEMGVLFPPDATGGVIMYAMRGVSHASPRNRGVRYGNYYQELALLQAYTANPYMDWRFQGFMARHFASTALMYRNMATHRVSVAKPNPAKVSPAKKPAAPAAAPRPRRIG